MGIKTHVAIIPNGIKLSRITPPNIKYQHKPFTFMAFAGRNIQKRVDVLLRASDLLIKQGHELHVIIIDANEPSISDELFDKRPNWLTILKPQENINALFSMADCFVSTSVHETFSYAIAEASIYGLPVIQSDIQGTKWNAHNPSTFLFKSLNIEDLASTMLKVMNIPEDYMNKLCSVTAAQNAKDYSLEAWAKKITDFFESI